MSIHFHKLSVKEVRKETPECVSVLFDLPEEIKKDFEFKQGQSLTMRTLLNGEEVRRTYSICGSPLDNEWRVAIKKQEGGLFSGFANERLKKGDVLEVMPPVGKFYTDLDPQQKKNYVAFAAGSGITPVISIIKTTLRAEPKSQFTMVYGNRNKNYIIFKEDLEGLKDKLIDYKNTDEFFICGPEEMIFCTRDFLEVAIERSKIHFELFTTPGENPKSKVRNLNSKITAEGPTS